MDEAVLIRKVLDGDADAFADLMKIHEKQVYNLCLRICCNAEDAKDLAQEAFFKAWRGLRFYKFESAFSTWLYRLTTNVCIDFLRRQKRQQTSSFTVYDEDDQEAQLEVPDPDPLPEEVVEQQERNRIVADAMKQLDDEFRTILTLRVVQELAYDEISQIMDLPIGTVKSRLARARNKLKKILENNGNILQFQSSESKERRRRDDL